MAATRFYSWTSEDLKAALFVADDDPAYAKVPFLVEVKSVDQWVKQWNEFSGFAGLVLDSEIRTVSERSPTEIREPRLIEWCNQRELFTNGQISMNRVAVVLSGVGGEVMTPVKRWYIKAERVEVSLRAILELVVRTAKENYSIDGWPDRLANSNEVISQVIHRLQNLFLPITLDLKTLTENDSKSEEASITSAEGKHAIVEILKDYFGNAQDGYLGLKSPQHDNTNIINCLEKHCKGLPYDLQNRIRILIEQFKQSVESASNWNKNHPTIAEDGSLVVDLREQLSAVASVGEAIIEELRQARQALGTKT